MKQATGYIKLTCHYALVRRSSVPYSFLIHF